MSLIVSEVYDALIEAGASPDTAKAAAGAVPAAENMVTKDEFARLAMATKEGFAKLKHDFARVESNMVTKDLATRPRRDSPDQGRIEEAAIVSFAVAHPRSGQNRSSTFFP